jgi:hypothetical protein
MEKYKNPIALDHREHENGSHSGSSEEKGIPPQNGTYVNPDDNVVTFKTWIVITVLASAYGVGCPLVVIKTMLSDYFPPGLFLDYPSHRCHQHSGCHSTRRPQCWRLVHFPVHNLRCHCVHDLWCKFGSLWPSLVLDHGQRAHVCGIYYGRCC